MAERPPRDPEPRRTPGTDVELRPGRDRSLAGRHPWIFSGAIASLGASLEDGDLALVRSADGAARGRGFVSLRSQIRVRMLTFDPAEPFDDVALDARIAGAIARRPPAGAARLVHAESDGLPGLVVDRYGDTVVFAISSAGLERRAVAVARALGAHAPSRTLYERSDGDGRTQERLPPRSGLVAGEEPPELVPVPEQTHDGGSVTLLVDVRRGHKTGGYLDQAESRRVVGALSRGADVLNLFSYTGGFGLHAAAGGARSVLEIDSSAPALDVAARAAAENGLGSRIERRRGDAFEALRSLEAEGRTFDVVVVDPPKLAAGAAHVARASRAYKDLLRLALRLVRPGGHVAGFSCSGAISAVLFQQIAWSAALEAGRDAAIVRRLGQPPDHPVRLTFPESEYLKGLLLRAP